MKIVAIASLAMLPFAGNCQHVSRRPVRVGDTVLEAHLSMKTGERSAAKGVWYRETSKWGMRGELAGSVYSYKGSTGLWLGRHGALAPGVQILRNNIFVGARISLATVTPKTHAGYGTGVATATKLNPIKFEYSVGCVVNLEQYLTLEPYAAVTLNKFYVLEDAYNTGGSVPAIPMVAGLTTGIGLNYYAKVRRGQFACIFFRYAHGFSNYHQISIYLDSGYNEVTMGVAYKGFFQKMIFKRVASTSPNANGGL